MEANRDYYCDLLKKCGASIGRESYVCDDGTVALEPLAAKIPQLVAELVERSKPINEIDRSFEVGVGDGGVGLASIRQMIELDKMIRN